MDDKKLNWKDLLRHHLSNAVVTGEEDGGLVLMVPTYTPDEANEQLREFIMEAHGEMQRVEIDRHQGFKMPGNNTVH